MWTLLLSRLLLNTCSNRYLWPSVPRRCASPTVFNSIMSDHAKDEARKKGNEWQRRVDDDKDNAKDDKKDKERTIDRLRPEPEKPYPDAPPRALDGGVQGPEGRVEPKGVGSGDSDDAADAHDLGVRGGTSK